MIQPSATRVQRCGVADGEKSYRVLTSIYMQKICPEGRLIVPGTASGNRPLHRTP